MAVTEENITVIDQLDSYCDCLDVKESDVFELINLISVQTCWTDKSSLCQTFLKGDRKEVVDLPDCICDCDVFTFEPKYVPFEPDSFAFTVIEQDGINETAIEITDYVYSAVDEVFRMELPLPDCKCAPKCGCEKKYKLLVTYVAGYELIPDCLLPVFCEALQWIKDKNECCCDCEPCEKESSEGVVDESTLTGMLQEYFITTLTEQYIRQLQMISVCRYKDYLWAVVV